MLVIARRRLGRAADADDVAAEVFAIAWEHHRSGGELTAPWLYRVLRNLIGNEYRRQARSAQVQDGEAGLRLVATDAEWAGRLDVRRAILLLPAGDRRVLYLSYWEGHNSREIASLLACSPTAVRVRLARARKRLAAQLREGERR